MIDATPRRETVESVCFGFSRRGVGTTEARGENLVISLRLDFSKKTRLSTLRQFQLSLSFCSLFLLRRCLSRCSRRETRACPCRPLPRRVAAGLESAPRRPERLRFRRRRRLWHCRRWHRLHHRPLRRRSPSPPRSTSGTRSAPATAMKRTPTTAASKVRRENREERPENSNERERERERELRQQR